MLLYVDANFASPYALVAFVSLLEKGLTFDIETVDLAVRANQGLVRLGDRPTWLGSVHSSRPARRTFRRGFNRRIAQIPYPPCANPIRQAIDAEPPRGAGLTPLQPP
jgi:hypothetical protein